LQGQQQLQQQQQAPRKRAVCQRCT
jgi:hypothetical protein